MDQLAESAHSLKIYEELTKRLYQILQQIENDRSEMESRIG
jgi:tetrahydromethanopterin S-methyltransferase subunit G